SSGSVPPMSVETSTRGRWRSGVVIVRRRPSRGGWLGPSILGRDSSPAAGNQRRAALPSPDTPGYRRCCPAPAPALLPSNPRDGRNETMATPPQDPYADPIFGYPPQPGPEPEAPKPQKHRRWPWVVGIVAALLIGVGIGASGEDPPPRSAEHTS